MLNITKKLAGAAIAASFALAPATLADTPSSLAEWAEDASKSVDAAMYYPKLAARTSGSGAASFRVTVDRDGDVISADKFSGRGSRILQGAAKRVVANADFPELPASLDADTLTFELRLNYGVAAPGHEQKSRPANVTSRRIAQGDGAVLASLRVVAAD